ncbi:MarR family transcriptional regulator [Solwaraspora sp. WMMD791]|uniref:MarR family winged helix-turn-helix transcriptional regulator n=1 Tax=Solwaraspora sp. WMMD791 TaxID=3016086 RepID=UPI00249BB868|nr:MarR family transcriptional regulator [Solwaraspora sp. WMMD791]WFE30252.1 MarR family transcriptional regulator [Solwaraspora sp. WMMD791]
MTQRDELIDQIMATHRRLQLLFASDRSDPLFDAQLTVPQLKILLLLYLHGSTSGQELSQVLGVRMATVTGIVDRLVAHRLVGRREDPQDRRVRRVELTDDGRDLIDRIVTAGTDRHARLLARLDTDELRTVAAAARLMVDAAEADLAETDGAAGRPRPAGACGTPPPVPPGSGQVERAGGE